MLGAVGLFAMCAGANADDTPARNLLYPLAIEINAGANANHWIPKPIDGTKMRTQGYVTAHVEAEASLFQVLSLERFRYERTVGTKTVERQFQAIDTVEDQVSAQLLDAILALYAPPGLADKLNLASPSMGLIGLGARLRHDVYNGELHQTEDKLVFHDNADDAESPAGTTHRFVTDFYQWYAGIAVHRDDPDIKIQGLAGIGYLRYRKPWQVPAGVAGSAETVLFSTMQGWGIGFVGEGHPKDKFVFFKGEGMFGWGDIQLTEGESLMDILETSGSDWKVGCLNIGGTIGIEYDWLKSERMDLYTAAFAGAAYYHFWLYAEGSDGTEGLTSDLRLHTGAEVRSSF